MGKKWIDFRIFLEVKWISREERILFKEENLGFRMRFNVKEIFWDNKWEGNLIVRDFLMIKFRLWLDFCLRFFWEV